MKVSSATALVAVLMFAAPATAATYSLEVRMGDGIPKGYSHFQVRAIKVKGGTVGEMVVDEKTRAVTVEVTMPDGVCVARTSVIFRNGERADTMTYDVCAQQGIVVDMY